MMRILICLLAFCFLTVAAGAIPPLPPPPELPDAFWGSVTLAGSPAPAGAVITAYIGYNERGSITVHTAGEYGGSGPFEERLNVMGTPQEVGRNITFWVDGIRAAQSVAYTGGTVAKLDLNADGIRGDFSGDGEVDIGDVAILAYMVVGKVPHSVQMDFNGNGKVDIGDASKIAYFSVGKIDLL